MGLSREVLCRRVVMARGHRTDMRKGSQGTGSCTCILYILIVLIEMAMT